MPYNNLDEIPKNTSIFVFVFGVFGSLINYTKRRHLSLKRRILYFLGDMVSSVMLAVITFTIAIGAGANEILAVGMAGFVAHQGTRAVYILELIIEKNAGIKITDKEVEND